MRTDALSRRFDDEHWARRKRAVLDRVRILDVVERMVKLKRVGNALQGCCPFHVEQTPSFTVYPRGGEKVKVPFFVCYGCGAKGDVITFVMKRQGLEFREAIDLLESENGLRHLEASPPPKRVMAAQLGDREKVERARRIWSQSRAVEVGDPVDLYLRGRCLLPPVNYGIGDPASNAGWPPDLRFEPQCWHDLERRSFAAMIAAIRAYDGTLLTVHRTYLAEQRGGGWSKAPVDKAKLVVGTFGPGFIRLGPDVEEMVGGEGIETSLSAMQLWRRSGICFVNSGRMKSVEPPFVCSDFIYAADKGGKGRWGERFALEGAHAFATGRKVAVKIPKLDADKGDFNDLLRLRAEQASFAPQ
jgi:DNA primase